ncbi:Very long chain fatty acid elongase [Formica fusca]
MDLSKRFHYYWTELADPRTNDWVLIDSIYQIPLIIIIYLYVILYWGPRFMKNRPPYSLKTFIKIYNIFQIIANAWLVREHLAAGWMKDIPLTCMPVIYSYEPHYYKYIQILWWFLLLKMIDCIETIMFMLRKKNKQISALHLYHHVSSLMFSWITVKYLAGEMSTFVTLVNCSVHVIMYTYYLLAAFGPRAQAIIMPVKSYITILQMVQFFGLILYTVQILMPNCHIPSLFGIMFLINVAINWFMFYKFYQKSYVSSKVKQ